MKEHVARNPCMVYPEDKMKPPWDLFLAFVLLFSCLVSPYRIAFVEKDNLTWLIINNTVDFLFLMDIVIIFNTAYYDEDFRLVSDRKTIAGAYLRSWFMVDFLAIIPFDVILAGSDMNDMVRLARIGRLYKLVKLMKVLRVLKLVRERNNIMKYVADMMKIHVGFERFLFFIIGFLLVCHIIACVWVIMAQLEDNLKGTWMEHMNKTAS